MELAGFPMEGVVISVTFRPFEAKCLENWSIGFINLMEIFKTK
jgi:hypothetical protein